MSQFIVCIDGLMGAGKSSLMQRLAADYNCFPEPLSEWTLLSSLYQNPEKYGFAFQLQVLISQFQQYQHFPKGFTIVERCPWTSRHIFAPLLLNQLELEIYDQVYQCLHYKVDTFIYLDLEPTEAFERICTRSAVDRQISLTHLKNVYNAYKKLKPDAYVVKANRSLEDVERDVRTLIDVLYTKFKDPNRSQNESLSIF